ncbi:MAG TPA: ABC transporter permease [Gaiellaceae bacterium]|nr:ABC transporter permease [Gaiellaceae bacterium]
MTTRSTRISLAVCSALVIAFLWIPLVIIALYAFNKSNIQGWPITSWTFHWFSVTWHNSEARSAFWLSVRVALATTGIALVLGTMAAAAVARFRFFGRDTVSFLLVLPLALPGIITGTALLRFYSFAQIQVSIWTIVIGHATFCVVVVYNNVVARLRRTSSSLIEASQDLGADGWQTFRFVLWPTLSTALVAGGLLAFALSFDEVIVTYFTAGAQETLPIFILDNIERGQQLPVVNVVAFFVIAVTAIPVMLAQRVMRDTGIIRSSAAPVTEAIEASEIPAA